MPDDKPKTSFATVLSLSLMTLALLLCGTTCSMQQSMDAPTAVAVQGATAIGVLAFGGASALAAVRWLSGR